MTVQSPVRAATIRPDAAIHDIGHPMSAIFLAAPTDPSIKPPAQFIRQLPGNLTSFCVLISLLRYRGVQDFLTESSYLPDLSFPPMKALCLIQVLSVALAINAIQCPAGWEDAGTSSCTQCPLGYYKSSQSSERCRQARPGYRTSGGNGSGLGSTAEVSCGAGFYSSAGSSLCSECQPGYRCPVANNVAGIACDAGKYQEFPGQSDCLPCPKGTFSNVRGATRCCLCCAGWFTENDHQTHCQRCVDTGKTGSPPGAKSKQECTSATLNPPVTSCDQDTNTGQCPATTLSANSSPRVRRSLHKRCENGQTLCPVPAGRGKAGFECLDTSSHIESCGGCVYYDGRPSTGRDCSEIENVNAVECYQGSCLIHSCRVGFKRGADGQSCERIKHKPVRHSHKH